MRHRAPFAVVLVLVLLGLADAQTGALALTNVRLTQGVLGPVRTDTKLLPGDSLVVSFDITGITADPAGKVLYSMMTEVTDKAGKVLFRQPARDQEGFNSLGGTTLPAFAQIDIGLDQPAGEHILKVAVTDRATKKTANLTQNFVVLPKAFGLVRIHGTGDAEGLVPAGLQGPGQSLFVNFAVVGFARDAQKQPNLLLEMHVLDDKGKPTVSKPFSGIVNKDVAATSNSVPAQFLVSLNRPGKFKIELKATDAVSKKSVSQSFPINVQ